MEKLDGKKDHISKLFVKRWNKMNVTLFGHMVKLDEKLVVEVTGLSMEGANSSGTKNFLTML